jgi:hypothetical protein
MDSEDGEVFIKQLAAFVRTHEKALANALQFQRRETRHRPSQSTSSVVVPPSPTALPDRPLTSSSSSGSLAATFSLGSLNFTSHSVKSAKLSLTPHHLFYLLSRFEDIGIAVGPMKVRLENLHDSTSSANYVSFLGNTQRTKSRGSDVGSIHSVSSVRSVMSGMSALWSSFGIGASISAARTERQKAAIQADMKYLYSAFTKIPTLRLAPDWRARLISGYEEFPFDSAVPLYAFKNLQALEVNSIDFRQFFGWDRLADQLRSLTLKRACIEDPADILIDIVLDDMDKRRRRTSKSQNSPTSTWYGGSSPRRNSIIPPLDSQRSFSMSSSPNARGSMIDIRVGSLTPSEYAIEDGSRSARDQDSDDNPKSPSKETRQRSNSPSRPNSSRNHSNHARSAQRIKRSGSSSSHSSLSDSWHHHHNRGSSSNLLALGVLPASKWRFLRHLSLADNSITSIPLASLAPLSNTLYSLDLSSNLFSQIPDSLATLTALRALNLSHCMIDSLHSLTRNPLPAITALNLRANRLQSLAGIERLLPLERLDLRDNGLSDPMELARLTGIPDIREVWVDGNPFVRTHKDYRVTIFNLFRKTPGYTEDIVIDGTGPSYVERRQLIERAPVPDSVPVVKPAPAEIPAVNVGKPTVVHEDEGRASATLRKERPSPKTATSEVNTSSTKRRKTPKRRIVDLATGDTPPSPTPIEVRGERTSPRTSTSMRPPPLPNSSTIDYRFPAQSDSPLLPPIVIPERNQSVIATATSEGRQMNSTVLSNRSLSFEARMSSRENNNSGGSSSSNGNDTTSRKEGQEWTSGGEAYRRKIEALRDSVGNGYLTALGEEGWDPSSAYITNGISAAPAMRAGMSSLTTAQPIPSGHTVG